MPYNTKDILKDVAGKTIPQYFNPASDTYEPLFGRNGANRVELYGPDGSPISVTDGKLNIRASEIEALAGALTDAAVTDPAASASIIALLKGLLKQIQGGTETKSPVDVVDRAARVLGKITADDGALATLGALANAAVTDPTASASVIALLKGLLKQLQGTGTGAAPVQLTGSNVIEDEIFNSSVSANTEVVVGSYTAERGEKVGFIVKSASTTTLAYLLLYARSITPSAFERTAYYFYRIPFVGTTYIPPVRVPYAYRVLVYNPQDSEQVIQVRRIRWFGNSPGSQCERIPLAVNLQIRDTAVYGSTNLSGLGRTNMGAFAFMLGGATPRPVFVKNGLDQQITVNIIGAPNDAFEVNLGSFTVPAGATVVKTHQDVPGLAYLYPNFFLKISAAAAPTTGAVDAWTIMTVEG